MSLLSRIFRLFRANASHLISQAEDPIKQLNLIEEDFSSDLAKMRAAVASAIASHQRLEATYNQAANKYNICQRSATLALQKGNEQLARDFLIKQKELGLEQLQAQLEKSLAQVNTLRTRLADFENQISQKKNQAQLLRSQAMTAKALEQFEKTVGKYGELDKIAEKVEAMEARSLAIQELSSDPLETQFNSLVQGIAVEDELSRLKAELGVTSNVRYLPSAGSRVSIQHEIIVRDRVG